MKSSRKKRWLLWAWDHLRWMMQTGKAFCGPTSPYCKLVWEISDVPAYFKEFRRLRGSFSCSTCYCPQASCHKKCWQYIHVLLGFCFEFDPCSNHRGWLDFRLFKFKLAELQSRCRLNCQMLGTQIRTDTIKLVQTFIFSAQMHSCAACTCTPGYWIGKLPTPHRWCQRWKRVEMLSVGHR